MKIALLRIWSFSSSLLFILVIAGAVGYLLYNAVPQLSLEILFGDTAPASAIFANAPVWDALWPAIAGTGSLLFLAMVFTLPLGIGTGVYLAEYATPKKAAKILFILEIFTSIPSIVIGLFGFLLIIMLKRTLMPSANMSLLLSAFCLCILVLPTFILTLHAALRSLPQSLRLTATSIGLSQHSAIWNIYVPAANKGLISAFFLSAGRCAEDTAVILMTGAIANANSAPSLIDKFEALPFFIYYTTANYQNEAEFMRIFAAAFFLLLIACLLLLMGHCFQQLAFKEWNKPV